ncbi:MAG: YegS/Rv2252/BmrU family lipid kinase [Clostridiales Family XIII bacterium]|jgi:YegS/Rv2252/BmrU family lipid kinase|nr:YegS/Rv2252/BmrU family lipid kinase [Clostridiales Family XIII bacterium]
MGRHFTNKVLLYYNPAAGNGVFRSNLDRVIEVFQRRHMLIIPARADRRDVLDRIFGQTDFRSYRKIIAAGGDGTINTLVSAMIKYDVDVPLAIFPSGTANDLAHYFDLPYGIEEMLTIALGERYTLMDVGLANQKCFVNVLAMGMMVDVSQKTDPNVKNTLGVMAYYLKGMAEIPRLRPIPVTITCPDRVLDAEICAMLIMNGRSAGGFKRVAPNASINDGLFDVILFRDMPIANLMPLLLGVLTGQHTEHKRVVHFRADRLRVESPLEVNTDVDGELGDPLPLDVRILPGRLRVCTAVENMEGNAW